MDSSLTVHGCQTGWEDGLHQGHHGRPANLALVSSPATGGCGIHTWNWSGPQVSNYDLSTYIHLMILQSKEFPILVQSQVLKYLYISNQDRMVNLPASSILSIKKKKSWKLVGAGFWKHEALCISKLESRLQWNLTFPIRCKHAFAEPFPSPVSWMPKWILPHWFVAHVARIAPAERQRKISLPMFPRQECRLHLRMQMRPIKQIWELFKVQINMFLIVSHFTWQGWHTPQSDPWSHHPAHP